MGAPSPMAAAEDDDPFEFEATPTSTIARRQERQTTQSLAFKMRIEGKTTGEIAGALDVAPSTVSRWITGALANIIVPDVEQYRKIEVVRLEELRAQLSNALDESLKEYKTPDLRIVDRLLKVSERLSKLLGLDVPVRVEEKKDDGPTIIEFVAHPKDQEDRASASPDPSASEREENHRAGGRNGQRQDVVRTEEGPSLVEAGAGE